MSDWVNIARGARKGCVLSLKLYTERIMKKIKYMDGVRMGGLNVNKI